MNNLKDKVIFITGASLGIGKETAFLFAKEKCKLALTYYKDEKEAKEVEKKCRDLGASEILTIKLDITNDESIKNAVKQITKKYGKIDILINNAGIVIWKKLQDHTFKDIENQLRTNLEGLIKLTLESLSYIKETIINLASVAGLYGYAEASTYCASKFGVRGFTQSLAEEIPNIKSYCINPGQIATRMNDFQGMAPIKVAEVILNVAKEKYNLPSGSDINIKDYVK